jgi:hypothetical protein
MVLRAYIRLGHLQLLQNCHATPLVAIIIINLASSPLAETLDLIFSKILLFFRPGLVCSEITMADTPVYQYLWKDYRLPLRKIWVLNLTYNEAIGLFAFITILIAFTQSTTWLIEHRFFNAMIRPKIQLPSENEDVLLSQGKAIGVLVQFFNSNRVHSTSIRQISPYLGALAIFNILSFSLLGIFLVSKSVPG